MLEKDNKTILYIIDKIEYGGAQVGMIRLLKELNPENINVATFYIGDSDIIDQIPADIEILNLKIDKHSKIYKIKPLVKMIKKSDIIVNSLWNSSVIGSVLGKIYGKKVINWKHSSRYQSWRHYFGYMLCYNISDIILADSKAVKAQIEDEGMIKSDRVHRVPISGIDTDIFTPMPKPMEDDSVRVGTIGRLVPAKGYSTLIKCAKKLPNYQFFVVSNEDKDGFNQVFGQLPENIFFIPEMANSDIPHFLNSLDIYFQPSTNEGLCITVLEAMSCAIPVVASSVGGIESSVSHGETGYKTTPGSIDDFCSFIDELAIDANKRWKFGRNGRERIKKHYSKSVLKRDFKQALNSLY